MTSMPALRSFEDPSSQDTGERQTPITSVSHPAPEFSVCFMVPRLGRTEWLEMG